MKYTLGVALLLMAAWLAWSALELKRQSPGARIAADPASLAAFGEIMRPIVLGALGYLALKTAVVYHVLDLQRWLSLFDLAAFFALLGAYGAWFAIRVRYREPGVQRPAEARAEIGAPRCSGSA